MIWPTWIQAISELWLALVTSVTLYVLWGYAKDTKVIAKNSSEQIEYSQRPFLAVAMRQGTEMGPGGWVIENQGFGPAVNIRCTDYAQGKGGMRWMAPLATKAEYKLPREVETASRGNVFCIEYESLSGRRYRTNVEWSNDDMKTEFHPLT
jgi:hypothetical protein